MNLDKKYLPSRKFVVSLSTVIALVIIIVAVRYSWTGKKETLVLGNQEITTQDIANIKSIDTDNDGLPDWEEALWKTDPKNPDTDGDGTPDGAEIDAGRNPLVPNTVGPGKEPNDKIDPKIIASNTADDAEWNSLNETQKFSRTLFSDYIAVQPADGSALTADQTNQLVANSVANLPDVSLEQKYLIENISVIDNPTAKDIANYYTKFNSIFNNEVKSNLLSEFSIMDTYTTNNDPKILKGLDKIIISYQKSAKDMIDVKTPAEIADSQLLYANSLYNLSILATKLKNVEGNPLIVMVTLNKYGDVINNLNQSLQSISAYASKNI